MTWMSWILLAWNVILTVFILWEGFLRAQADDKLLELMASASSAILGITKILERMTEEIELLSTEVIHFENEVDEAVRSADMLRTDERNS